MSDIPGMGLAALSLARRGFHVFPIRAGTKDRPLGKWKEMATADEGRVTEMWRLHPDANVGVACGPSGLAVVDLDIKRGKDGRGQLDLLELDHGLLPATLTATTPSGGTHIYMRARSPVKSTVEALAAGVDTRGEKGYVLAPPSSANGGSNRWVEPGPLEVADCPEWVSRLAGAPRERDELKDEPAAELDTEYNLARAARHLADDAEPAVEGEGGNARTYAVACSVRDLGVSRGRCAELMLEHYSPRCQPPWEADELSEVVAHAYRYAVGRLAGSSPDADFGAEGEGGDEAVAAPRAAGVYDDFVWAAVPQWFVRRSDGRRLSKAAMDSLYDFMVEGRGHFSDTVFNSKTAMRKFVSLQFRPGAPEFLGEEYNLWKDTGVAPSDGDASVLEEHLAYMCGDEAPHVLDFLAHLVQRRGEKLSYALLVQGGQGIGKSWLGALMRAVLGRTNVEFPTNEELHSNFTEWALGRELVVIQELMASGRQQMANKLKPLITEDYVRVEEKHKTPYTVENHMNFLIFTNHEDPIPLERDDRRFLVVMSRAEPRGQAYYDCIWDWFMFGDGAAAAHGWLLRRDISRFNPKGRAPATEAKEAMRRAGLHEVEAHLLEMMEAEEGPFACPLVSTQDLADALPERMRRAPRLHNVLGRFLRQEAGARSLGQHRVNGGSQRRVLWSVRRHEVLASSDPVRRADIYDRARMEGADFGGDAASTL